MKVAGLGFRKDANMQALSAALDAACGDEGAPDALATLAEKANTAQFQALARARGLPIRAVPLEAIRGQQTLTHSADQIARFGTGSLAEAVALVAAGPGAALTGPRVTDPSRQATAAIAISKEAS